MRRAEEEVEEAQRKYEDALEVVRELEHKLQQARKESDSTRLVWEQAQAALKARKEMLGSQLAELADV